MEEDEIKRQILVLVLSQGGDMRFPVVEATANAGNGKLRRIRAASLASDYKQPHNMNGCPALGCQCYFEWVYQSFPSADKAGAFVFYAETDRWGTKEDHPDEVCELFEAKTKHFTLSDWQRILAHLQQHLLVA